MGEYWIFYKLCGGEISAEIKVHFTSSDSTEYKLCVEHSQLGHEHVSNQVNVLLTSNHNIVHTPTAVQLLHLLCCLSSAILNPEYV